MAWACCHSCAAGFAAEAGVYYAYSSIRNAYTVLSIPGVVEAGKRPEIEAFMLGTPKESYIFPEEVDRARSAWSQAEEFRRQGRELFKTLPMLGGHEVNVGQATGMVGTTYTPGYTLIFRRQVE